jgi:predicted ATPase
VSLCLALTWCGCPLALRLGDLDGAERLIAQLQAQAEGSGLRAYLACAVALEGHLAARRGDLARGEARLRAGLAALGEARNAMFATPYRIDLAQLLLDQGRADDAMAVVAEAAARAETHGGWCATELLRVQGEIARLKGDAGLAEAALNRAMARARREGALTWELRAAISLGQLRAAQGETRQAHDLLSEVHARFTEGFDAPDPRRAQALLASWGTA